MLYRQSEKDIIDPQTEMHYAILSSFGKTKFPHSHDFFEIFLLIEGKQIYEVNDKTYQVEAGSLILVRPNEVHSRKYIEKGLHINVAFSTDIAHSIFKYLGDGFPTNELLLLDELPLVVLDENERKLCRYRLEELKTVDYNNPEMLRTKVRVIVMELFTHYFYSFGMYDKMYNKKNESIPRWFSLVLRNMEKPENFTEGIDKLLEFSRCTHEHLCRMFQSYLQCTPTEYINNLKLNYAANNLTYSDTKIIDIAYDAGFDNLSHFYHVFKKKFNTSPVRFRKMYKQYQA